MGRVFEYCCVVKEKCWDKMFKLFLKLGKVIMMVVKEGGDDLMMNVKLCMVIQNVKVENMLKDNIDVVIKCVVVKDVVLFIQVDYEGKGLYGVLVYVECVIDNLICIVVNVKLYFNKVGGGVVLNGQFEFMFNCKVVFELEKVEGLDVEELELELIDVGCEEIGVIDDCIVVYGDYMVFGEFFKVLEGMNFVLFKVNFQWILINLVEFSEEQFVDIEKMFDKIEDDDDIQQVFMNIV